jgi:FMN reductase
MTTRTIAVVSAGLSQPSSTRLLADRLAQSVRDDLLTRGVEAEVHVHELREHAHDITNAMLTGFAPSGLQEVVDDVVAADGLIVVTPIFTASYSGLFKSFFDVLDDGALEAKPVLLGATGGTARHSLALEFALRPLFAYLRASVAPTAVFAASEDFGTAGAGISLATRADRAGRELADLVLQRPRTAPTDPFDNPTPFGQLLGS